MGRKEQNEISTSWLTAGDPRIVQTRMDPGGYVEGGTSASQYPND